MISFAVHILLYSAAIYFACWLLPGMNVDNLITALVMGAVIKLINIYIKPLLILISLPITIITLGLFLFVINAVVLLLASEIIAGFTISSFWWALFGSIIISAVYSLFTN